MATKVTPTAAHTRPAVTEVAEDEIKEYIYDATKDLGEGQTPVNPTVALNAYTGDKALIAGGATLDDPAVEDNRIYIRVANIEARKAYLLTIEFDHSSPRVADEHTVRYHVIDGV